MLSRFPGGSFLSPQNKVSELSGKNFLRFLDEASGASRRKLSEILWGSFLDDLWSFRSKFSQLPGGNFLTFPEEAFLTHRLKLPEPQGGSFLSIPEKAYWVCQIRRSDSSFFGGSFLSSQEEQKASRMKRERWFLSFPNDVLSAFRSGNFFVFKAK